MGYEIVYQRAAIQLDDERFLLLIQHGSNNCFEVVNGREVAEKRWGIIPLHLMNRPDEGDPRGNKTVFLRKSDLESIKEELFVRFNGELFKSRNNMFLADEFPKWIMSSLKNMRTVEEHKKAWNDIMITTYQKPSIRVDGEEKIDTSSTGYDCFKCKLDFPNTTEELISLVEKYQKDDTIGRIDVGFTSRERLRPTRDQKKSRMHIPKEYNEFFVLKIPSESSYLSRMGSRRYWFSYSTEGAKKFKSEKDARAYVARWQAKIPNFKFSEVKKIEERAYI